MKHVRVRLIRKLADTIDGVDLSNYTVGDVLNVEASEARLLVAEGWAVSATRGPRDVRQRSAPLELGEAADSERRTPVDQLRRVSEQIGQRRLELPHGRRREDALLDELHDSRSKIIRGVDDAVS